MSEQNKAIINRLYEEVWNKGNLEVIDEIQTTNYVDHGPSSTDITNGLEEFKQLVTMYRNSFPDLNFAVEEIFAIEDKVARRWTVTGTHQGELMGIPPTGKQVVVAGISISRINGGKIEETWDAWDTGDLLRQLGVIPTE